MAGQRNKLGEATLFALALCRSLLVGWRGGCPPYLCCFFVLFCRILIKHSAIENQTLPLTTTSINQFIPPINFVLEISLAMQERKEIDKIPIEEAMELLRKCGMDVEREQAEQIMDFLYNLTMIIIQECFDTE